ncbi:unnamed protein product [Heligmosomoides polygyrus]|uniref:PRKCSH_1 domain-containing protein n=1 Tax=Heligmosomoides polygyrus TaxID=6339 RepID=A0A183FLS4_HELPZ|nr:unnamed protein product [Heligmosomoides polygyrus]
MKFVVAAKERLYHFFSAYAPQTGSSDQAKDKFWNLLDERTAEVSSKALWLVTLMETQNLEKGYRRDTSSCKFGARHYEAWTTRGRKVDLPVDGRCDSNGSREKSFYHVFFGEKTVENCELTHEYSSVRLPTGMLCDRKIPEHLTSKIYRAVVRPVAVYDAECWPAAKETKMQRWKARVTRMDCIRNDAVRQKF